VSRSPEGIEGSVAWTLGLAAKGDPRVAGIQSAEIMGDLNPAPVGGREWVGGRWTGMAVWFDRLVVAEMDQGLIRGYWGSSQNSN
jgi:hypothetical protein